MKVLRRKLPVKWVYGCTGKMRYDTSKAANDSLLLLRAKEPNKEFAVYRCPNCNKFHAGSR